MKENVKRVINLTNLFGLSVSWTYIITVLFLYPAITGAVFGLFNHSLFSGIFGFLLIFSLPGVFLALFGKLIFTKAKIKHLYMASSIGVFFYSTLFLFFYFVAKSISLEWMELSIVVSGLFSSLIWYFVGSVFFKSPRKAILFAIIQFIVYTSVLSLFTYVDASALNGKFVLSSIVFIAAIGFTYYLISLPIKRNFGYSGLEMMRMFFAQWLYREKDLEDAFSSLSQKARLFVDMFIFKSTNKLVSSFVVPSIHYGPFGMLCSSNFPSLLKSSIQGATAFHSASTHDLNLSNSNEAKKLVATIKSAYSKKKEFTDKFSFLTAESDDKKAKAAMLLFGENAFVMLSRAPLVTEDMDFSLGFILREKLKSKYKNVSIVDMHNSEGKDITYFGAYSPEGYQYISAVENLLKKRPIYKKLKFSYIHLSKESLNNETLGGAGISIYSFDWKKPIILVVVDGNAIKNSCKKTIENLLKNEFDTPYVFVLTTDSHEINAVRGVVNEYICTSDEKKMILEGARRAVENMKSAEVSFIEIPVVLKILGKDFSVELISTLNSSLAIAKILIPIGLLFSILLSLYVLSLI